MNGEGDDFDVFASDCEFKDEFSSFRGVSRFRRNVNNFAKVIEADTLVCSLRSIKQTSATTLAADWIFSGNVKLINKKLSAAGTTTYTLSKNNKIVTHDERWKTSKTDVLKNLIK